mmetsp:Transcript_4271/g.5177  ORF Transcript_4271/g.5177 Transcript_4271/m.5177 type:complete len:98 (+) Transcript_4271:245-538(+)
MSSGFGIDLAAIKRQISTYESAGTIDKSANLKNSNVFLFSGTMDFTVSQKVMKEAENFYKAYGADVQSNFSKVAGHTMPTENYGNTCTMTSSPFIGK